MKTETMKNDFVNFLDQLGIAWKYLLNGLIGGTVWSIYKKTSFWESVRQIFIGGIVSGYVTPLIASKTDITYVGFLSFVVGMIGMVVIEVIYKWLVKKFKLIFD